MFTKLASEIDFNDIDAFCREWAEGVRVEYKSKIVPPAKIISAFANTQGGFLIIGVECDKAKNKAVIPIRGIPNEDGIEERIVQSAITGIHPAVNPEVIIRDVPGETNRVVVVVRVHESPQAPHALQNSNRVYVRVGSISQPYEKEGDKYQDAGIDRIDYMLKRREEPQRISRQILDRIEERVRKYSSQLGKPNLEIVARPVFPYRPIVSPSKIFEFIDIHAFIPTNPSESNFGRRNVAGGACFMGNKGHSSYWELNEYGIVYERAALSLVPWRNPGGIGNESRATRHHLDADGIGAAVFNFIWLAKDFFQACKYLGNIEITVRLREIDDETLKFTTDRHPGILEERKSLEPEVSASDQCLPHHLGKADAYEKILIGLLQELFWVFNVRDNEGQWQDRWRDYVAKRVGR